MANKRLVCCNTRHMAVRWVFIAWSECQQHDKPDPRANDHRSGYSYSDKHRCNLVTYGGRYCLMAGIQGGCPARMVYGSGGCCRSYQACDNGKPASDGYRFNTHNGTTSLYSCSYTYTGWGHNQGYCLYTSS